MDDVCREDTLNAGVISKGRYVVGVEGSWLIGKLIVLLIEGTHPVNKMEVLLASLLTPTATESWFG